MASKNKCAKTRKIDDPYEIWKCRMDFGYGDILEIEYRNLKVLKVKQRILLLGGLLLPGVKLLMVIGSMEIPILEIFSLLEGGSMFETIASRLIVLIPFIAIVIYILYKIAELIEYIILGEQEND